VARTALRALVIAGLLGALIGAAPVAAQSSGDATSEGSACDDNPAACAISAPAAASVASLGPWMRSIVCPVLYTHEVVSQLVFRRMLTAILAAGYRPTSLATVDAAMSGAIDPPPRCLVLTFDDALYSQYLNALPVLSQLGVPGAFFALVPGFADGVHRYMGLPELQAIEAAGDEVEAHTCNHPNLAMLERLNFSAVVAEVQDCKEQLEAMIGASVNYLAYPFGAYDATVVDTVSRAGYRAAFTTRASARLTASTPYSLPRIRYDPSEAPLAVIRRIRASGG
jgi:peptidoglycan/xylan/chitin deacetylase (PgdA/CDA1 family)